MKLEFGASWVPVVSSSSGVVSHRTVSFAIGTNAKEVWVLFLLPRVIQVSSLPSNTLTLP